MQLHSIYTKLIHPDHLVLHQVDVEKFHLSRATDRKMVTDALNSRGYAWELDVGKQEIRFWRKTPRADLPARALDVAEVREVRGVRVVTPTELKKESLLLESVKGGVHGGDINAEFKLRDKGRKALGGQLEVEDWVKDLATRAKVDRIGIKGQDIVDDAVHRIEIAPENLEKSHVSAYETPDKKLFESARKAGAPSKLVAPPGGTGGTGSPSADSRKVTRPSTEAKGPGEPPTTSAEIREASKGEVPTGQSTSSKVTPQGGTTAAHESLPGDSPARRRSSPRVPAPDAPGAAVPQSARGTLGTAVDDRGLGGSGTIGELAESKGALKAAERQLPKPAKSGRTRTVARFALKGSMVVMTAGKFVFRLVEFANPIMNVLMLVDAVDWLVGWLQREKKAEQAEWRRIAHLLSAPSQTVRLPPYNMPYTAAYGEAFSSLAERTLAGEYGRGNFLDWLQKWENTPAWGGFVYARATAWLERQELQHSDDDEPYPVAYYPRGGPWDVLLTDRPGPNWKKQGPSVGPVADGDERNLRTGGKGGSYYDPEHFVVVEISSLQVQYTYPDPVLTPFDYILVKCNALAAEVVAFLSKYDPQIVPDMDVRSEIIPGVASQNWLAGYSFEYPLYGKSIQWCLEVINNAIILLRRHRPIQGDERRPNPPQNFNAGYHRRLQMLFQLSSSAGPSSWSFQKIATQLPAMLRDENPK